MDIDEKTLEERKRLIDHCDHFFRPPASFYSALEEAIALAAAGRMEQAVTFTGSSLAVAGVIEEYGLEEFVKRAKGRDGPER